MFGKKRKDVSQDCLETKEDTGRVRDDEVGICPSCDSHAIPELQRIGDFLPENHEQVIICTLNKMIGELEDRNATNEEIGVAVEIYEVIEAWLSLLVEKV